MIFLNRHHAKFVTSAVDASGFPQTTMPEFAFVGRSNVGKSSMINALLNRKGLAKVGGTPGKTRTINFFDIDSKLHLVDLPGYGYASVSNDYKKNWAQTIEAYLKNRKQLELILLLVDLRHPPTKDDQMMFQWIKTFSISFMILATKSDKITKTKMQEQKKMIADVLGIEAEKIIPFSSTTKQGVEEVWQIFLKSIEGRGVSFG